MAEKWARKRTHRSTDDGTDGRICVAVVVSAWSKRAKRVHSFFKYTRPSPPAQLPTHHVSPSSPHRALRHHLLSPLSFRPRRTLSHPLPLQAHRAAHPLPRSRPLLFSPQ